MRLSTVYRTILDTGRIAVVSVSTLVYAQLVLSEQHEARNDGQPAPSQSHVLVRDSNLAPAGHREVPDDPWMPRPSRPPPGAIAHSGPWTRGPFKSIQVNVDEFGNNILGDAANEPSIAIDPRDPSRIVIGWRQFDTVESNFRQAGWAFSDDWGQTWTFPGVLDPGVFRSDPVLDADLDGNLYFYSLTDDFTCDLFKSVDGGVSWLDGVPAFGGDKAWMAIDRTEGIGRGNVYFAWSPWWGCCSGYFTRSTDGGLTFMEPITIPLEPYWGTLNVGPEAELYVAGASDEAALPFVVAKSSNAEDPGAALVFESAAEVDLGGYMSGWGGPNPQGLLGQAWIATDHSGGPTRGHVYLLCSVAPYDGSDPLEIMFARSTNGGVTWSDPVRVNDDPQDNGAWQWFGTMSVAPNGRIDVVFNDTRNTGATNLSELFYAFSYDGGRTWSKNVSVSQVFDSHIGWPNQNKLGDYYDMISDDAGVNIAYAATFNGEQDVYFLRIHVDCNLNESPDACDIDCNASAECEAPCGFSEDCNENGVPDECEPDCNDNDVPDTCDVLGGHDCCEPSQAAGCSNPAIRDCVCAIDPYCCEAAWDRMCVEEVDEEGCFDCGFDNDCNDNSIPDECEPDYDEDGLIDVCDPDIDDDGVLNEADVCDFTPPGTRVQDDGRPLSDTNGNCNVDLIDYWRFRNCSLQSGPSGPAPPEACISAFDYDSDGDVDLADFGGFMNVFTGL